MYSNLEVVITPDQGILVSVARSISWTLHAYLPISRALYTQDQADKILLLLFGVLFIELVGMS